MEYHMASLWSYQETIDELKQRLLYTTMELEAVKSQASVQMKKHKEFAKQSLELLRIAIQERDEANAQLQKVLNQLIIPSTNLPQIPPESSPLMKPTRANSSITESNSFSEPYTYHSQNSSPVDSFLDPVSSPGDSGNTIAFANQPFVQDYKNGTMTTNFDQASLIIDNLVKGKTLPQKGYLLQSVLEAGPLLQTLLVAGPLPRWRNPPPLQTFHIPPVSMKGCDAATENVGQKTGRNLQSYVEISCGNSSQMMSTSMMNFGNGDLSSCVGSGRLMASAGANGFVPASKRQRFH